MSKDAGIVITAASGFSPVRIKLLSSFNTKADNSVGVLDVLSDLILIVSVVPIFRLNRAATLVGSFSAYVLACSPTMMRSFRKATTDGSVSLNPVGFLKISTLPLLNFAISEFVVPRSIPKLIMLICESFRPSRIRRQRCPFEIRSTSHAFRNAEWA